MSEENTAKKGINLNEVNFKISGDKIKLEDRQFLKCSFSSQGPRRPLSAVPSLSLYSKDDSTSNIKSRRPYSADNLLHTSSLDDYKFSIVEDAPNHHILEQENGLESSQIFQDLILEPIKSCRSRSSILNTEEPKEINPHGVTNILKAGVKENNLQSQCALTPGLTTKPPLPKKQEPKYKMKASAMESNLSNSDEIEIIRLKSLKFEEDSIKKHERNNLNNRIRFKIEEIKSERDFNIFLEQTQSDIEKNVSEEFMESYQNLEKVQVSEVSELGHKTLTVNEQPSEIVQSENNIGISSYKIDKDFTYDNWLQENDDVTKKVSTPETHADILLSNTKHCEEETNRCLDSIQKLESKIRPFNYNDLTTVETEEGAVINEEENVDVKFENFFREYDIGDKSSKRILKNNHTASESRLNKRHLILKDKLDCINETKKNKMKNLEKPDRTNKDKIVAKYCEEESWMSVSAPEIKEECEKDENTEATNFNSTAAKSKVDNNTKVNKWLCDERSTNTSDNDFLDVLENIDDLHVDASIFHQQVLEVPQHCNGTNNERNTYDDIVQILKVLEAEDRKSHMKMETMKDLINQELRLQDNNNKLKPNSEDLLEVNRTNLREVSGTNIDTNSRTGSAVSKSSDQGLGSTSSLNSSTSNYNQILSFLDDVDKSSSKTLTYAKERVQHVTKLVENAIRLDTVPKREDLASLTTEELYDQIIDLNLRLKDKSSSIKLLQEELSSVRGQVLKLTKESDAIVKQKLKLQKEEHESVVKRHQKFIDQLISDKKVLNQQCESLICEIKLLEERYNSNMKATEHKHQVELKKVREMHMAGEKIRRERWIDNKTQKIKELTVKGLEPELHRMTLRHQQEISDLRALHKNELEDLELKAARKTQQQCEAIREQMTEEREKAITQEREIMRQRYEKLVENEEKEYQNQKRRLQQEYTNRVIECEEKQNASIAERDKAIKQAQEEFEDKLQAITRRHGNEIKVLKETITMEAEAWKNNYRQQQALQLLQKEGKMREHFKKERDREIEEVIERLETEANETRMQIELATENKIRRIKEKFEIEIRDLEQSEKQAKAKHAESKSKLIEYEETITELRTRAKLLEMQLLQSKEILDKMSEERSQIKEVVRKEMKQDISALEKEVARSREEKDKELQQVYSRVKLAVAKKDEVLAELSRDHAALQEKCLYLENILEQQRKEYLIK